MSALLQFMLILHVLLGLSGIVFTSIVVLGLLREKPAVRMAKNAALAGFLSFALSWVSGGYYYLRYYGKAVRDGIKAGSTPWAHTVLMEAKEHIFLFLPFASLIVLVALVSLGAKLEQEKKLKNLIALLALIILLLGLGVAFAGIVISSAAGRPTRL